MSANTFATPSVTTFVDRILEARRTGVAVDPGAEPQNHAEAYEAQRLTAERLGTGVAGWKVANHPAIGPIAAPIFAALSHGPGAAWPLTPGLGIEIEVALRLARDLPRGDYTRQDIAAAVDGYAVGVELVSTRLTDPQRNPFALLGDLMINAGYVSGPLQEPRAGYELAERRCLLEVAGRTLHDAPCKPPALDPFAIVAIWLTRADDRLGGLKAGQYVTTGSVCGIVPVSARGPARAEIEGLGAVAFDLA
jgi:2-keto-4-pentenoate hydratase